MHEHAGACVCVCVCEYVGKGRARCEEACGSERGTNQLTEVRCKGTVYAQTVAGSKPTRASRTEISTQIERERKTKIKTLPGS